MLCRRGGLQLPRRHSLGNSQPDAIGRLRHWSKRLQLTQSLPVPENRELRSYKRAMASDFS